MAHYDLEEQEQIDELKAWWKQYGNLVTGLVVAVALGVLSWQGWNWYQNSQNSQAATVYGALEQAVMANDAQRIKTVAGELTEKFARTPYAALGAMMAAKASFEAGDAKTARLQLSWAADNGKNEVRDLARLRLAALLIDDKAYDEALKQLNGSYAPAFAPRFNDLKGEVLLAQGKKAEARAAFQAAVTALDDKTKADAGNQDLKPEQLRGPYREILQQKIDALGGAA